MRRLAIVTTHPIQYYAPIFDLLAGRGKIDIKVFYTWGKDAMQKHDPGFGRQVDWDVPLLDGYHFEWANNTAKDAGSHHFRGIVNPDLTGQINAYQPDALLVIGWCYHSHLMVMRHFKGKIPVYFRGDSTLLDAVPGLKTLLRAAFLRWVYHLTDHVFYTGTNNKNYLLKHGLKADQLSFTPHAVDNAFFAACHCNEAKALRQSLNIADDTTLILFAGKFEDKKDPFLLLDAFLKTKLPNTALLFTGNGVLEDSLKAKAQGSPNVHFLDFKNQSAMPVTYQACDLFCLPSKGPAETWGLAVNEAMAAGKAILVSDKVGCATDLVKPGYNGTVFRAASLDDLQEQLKALLTKGKPALKQMGQASKEIIKHWNFEQTAKAIERQLLNQSTPDA
ncbi:hypothetical protein GCM10023149_32270 [Mucilaginibacter gynuensis]|uniref:Glycosyl transferase family 1 domain-containing protein n=1 Tax=Mucilaginibacter gynuensis TaxID=1302236 RepID=A0ABP8GQ53_9SPHI